MSRLHLAPYALLALIFGCAYIFGDAVRTQTPVFQVPKFLAPIEVWGCMFLVGFVAISGAALLNRGPLMFWSVFLGGVIFTWWACLFAYAAVTDQRATLTGWAVHAFVAYQFYRKAWRIKVHRW